MCDQQLAYPDGRILILVGQIVEAQVTLATYYAPNTRWLPFFPNLWQPLSLGEGLSIYMWGLKFNNTLHP